MIVVLEIFIIDILIFRLTIAIIKSTNTIISYILSDS